MKNAGKNCFWLMPTIVLVGLMLSVLSWAAPVRPAHGDAKPTQARVDRAAAEFFEMKVRPTLAKSCYGCHGPDARQGGLRMDSQEAILKGGKSGPAVVPGSPSKSLLIAAIQQTGKLKMPLGGKLEPQEVAALTTWVAMGAPWPSAAGALAAANGDYVISPEQKAFWSFQPVKKPEIPAVRNVGWIQSPIDRFVLAGLEAHGLKPAPPADRRTLIRRATFDLTGLPPTPEAVNAFVTDKSPNSFAKVVDRLLASPRYGECWARHWLDVARYADTKGYEVDRDSDYPYAYTYRDWVIRAFNTDLPYDQFIMRQLAADRLPGREQDPRMLAAMGFLTVGRRFLNVQPDIINDRIDVTMRGLQGLTVACARCHNHKFDPIPTQDYYSLYGIFASSHDAALPISPHNLSDPYVAYDKKLTDLVAREQAIVVDQVDKLRKREENNDTTLTADVHDVLLKTALGVRPRVEPYMAKIEPFFESGTAAEAKSLRKAIEDLRMREPAKPEFAMAMEDSPPVHQHIFRHGNENDQGADAPARFLQVLSPEPREIWNQGSGRLELARAIASKSNPLTARVFVNRVWLHYFGAGLVRTPSDFGKQGDRPTNQALLDYLAWAFMDNDWSIKKLQRMIMLSSAYHMSSDNPDAKAFTTDPANRLLWRMNRRRLEFEPIRDSLLAVSGALDTKVIGGPSIDLLTPPYPTRRTLYGMVERQDLSVLFRAFDFASPDATNPQRFVTTVPQQALFFMNSSFVAEQARTLARRADFSKLSEAHRINFLYQLLYARMPTQDEVTIALRYIHAPPLPTIQSVTAPIWRYGYGRFSELTQRVTVFTDLPIFDGDFWRAEKMQANPVMHSGTLSADGGRPGPDTAHAIIRRWTAPQNGRVAIHGTVKHDQDKGDGIRARIVSSRSGLLGEWTLHKSNANTEILDTIVKKGDTIDFVVDCRVDAGDDGFWWSPTIMLTNGMSVWSAHDQFHGPDEPLLSLTNWESYIQALLMTNEFVFLD